MPSRYVVGIDLGTTNSALAYADTGVPEGKDVTLAHMPVPQVVQHGGHGGEGRHGGDVDALALGQRPHDAAGHHRQHRAGREQRAKPEAPDHHLAEQGVGSHFAPSGSFLKCEIVM